MLKRDGRNCWLCGRLFTANPGKPGRRMTLEHLTPRCRNGSDGLDNLVLCHATCNRHLRDHPREKKFAIRRKWMAEEARRRGAVAGGRSGTLPLRDGGRSVGEAGAAAVMRH